MAWDIAAFVAAAAVLVAAGAFTAGVFRVFRSMRRWDRMAIRLALKADDALGEYVRFAREARETTQLCRHTLDGFARLADGARAVGEAAESAAQAAADVTSFWREKAFVRSVGGEDDSAGIGFDWAGIGRQIGTYIRSRLSGQSGGSSAGSRPGTSADPNQGE